MIELASMELDHIGIAVQDLQAAKQLYAKLGIPCQAEKDVPEQGVKAAVLKLQNAELELLQPIDPSSPVAKFLERRGPGLHHLAIRVTGLEQLLGELSQRGLELIDVKPRPGAFRKKIAFLHPRSLGGVLLELCED